MEYVDGLEPHERPDFILAVDDDIEFGPHFMEQLLEIVRNHNIDLLSPTKENRQPRKKRMFQRLLGGRTESSRYPYKIAIGPAGSFIVNNSLPGSVNPTQSGIGQCLLIKTGLTHKLKYRMEMWLDQTRYAWPEDQVFFYKAYLLGLNVMACKTPTFVHLDGKAGVTSKQRKVDGAYVSGRNGYIFWYRFIKGNRSWSAIRKSLALGYKNMAHGIFFRMQEREKYKAFARGLRDGKQYCKNGKTTIFTAD